MRYPMLVIGVLIVFPSGASGGDFKSMFAQHWQVAREFTLAVAEAMPADDYDFKPNPDELSFGRLMTHFAAQNSESCASATGTAALAEPATTDKATALNF